MFNLYKCKKVILSCTVNTTFSNGMPQCHGWYAVIIMVDVSNHGIVSLLKACHVLCHPGPVSRNIFSLKGGGGGGLCFNLENSFLVPFDSSVLAFFVDVLFFCFGFLEEGYSEGCSIRGSLWGFRDATATGDISSERLAWHISVARRLWREAAAPKRAADRTTKISLKNKYFCSLFMFLL